MTKRLLWEGQEMNLAALRDLAGSMQSLMHLTEDHFESVQAFIEKRKPIVTGNQRRRDRRRSGGLSCDDVEPDRDVVGRSKGAEPLIVQLLRLAPKFGGHGEMHLARRNIVRGGCEMFVHIGTFKIIGRFVVAEHGNSPLALGAIVRRAHSPRFSALILRIA